MLCAKCGGSERIETEFPPLPKGESYSLHNSDQGTWSLNGLTNIASGIALTLRSQPPYGKGLLFIKIRYKITFKLLSFRPFGSVQLALVLRLHRLKSLQNAKLFSVAVEIEKTMKQFHVTLKKPNQCRFK